MYLHSLLTRRRTPRRLLLSLARVMSTDTYFLPTSNRLNRGTLRLKDGTSAVSVAEKWLESFREMAAGGGDRTVTDLFLADAFWRDHLALTSDFRTIHGHESIGRLLASRVQPSLNISEIYLSKEATKAPVLRAPFPDFVLIQACFDFRTRLGNGTGVVRLVPVEGDEWKAYTMYTCLDTLSQYPAKTGIDRDVDASTNGISWESKRREEFELTNGSPSVLIIGAGHSGLEVASRLKALGVSSLIVEKGPEVANSWRNRYRSLWLHDPVWYNQLPHMPFPSSWPVYCPGAKLGEFLDSYAKALELNVWTESTISAASYDESRRKWTIFATGLAGVPNVPEVPNKNLFRGKQLHSSEYRDGTSYAGMRVVVVGGGNSAHDICEDLYKNGATVTMYQRSSTFVISRKAVAAMLGGVFSEAVPTDVSDRLNASFPLAVAKLLHQRVTPAIVKNLDNDVLQGLATTEFKTNMGPEDAGLLQLLLRKAGGYYVDTGASQLIIDGHIQVKNGSAIKEFTQDGLMFEDGTHLDADVVVFATGYGDPREIVANICGKKIADKLDPVWGVDAEGELNSAWRQTKQEGLWFAMGNLALSRFYSSFLALQIKAIEENILPPRYME